VSKLDIWFHRTSLKPVLNKALNCIYPIAQHFLHKGDLSPEISSTTTTSSSTTTDQAPEDEAFYKFCEYLSSDTDDEHNINKVSIERMIKDEKKIFLNKIQNIDKIK